MESKIFEISLLTIILLAGPNKYGILTILEKNPKALEYESYN
jgi:hypothetical protein